MRARRVRRPVSSHIYVVIALAIAASALIGCGAERKQRTVTLTGSAVEIAADQYYFDPSHVIARRGRLDITYVNKGNLLHNLVLLSGAQRVAKASPLEPGNTAKLSVRLKPGKYTLLCTVGDHEDLGMRGEVEVR